jgi:hypothetical protein
MEYSRTMHWAVLRGKQKTARGLNLGGLEGYVINNGSLDMLSLVFCARAFQLQSMLPQ